MGKYKFNKEADWRRDRRLVQRFGFRSEGRSSLRRMEGIASLDDMAWAHVPLQPGNGSLTVPSTDHRQTERPGRNRVAVLGVLGAAARSFYSPNAEVCHGANNQKGNDYE